ncbi:hypothetical protein CHS0354_022323 [Potamilus streckersoni]|uniref:Uncharacterized protein n=1 Tax=Potamilus streckersoni TaxID=2493646 RepID=A0AAE0WD32_9BIVA|nr:hypothetical protein CHS0354_022323 [Potamilus streckersoni]
MNENFETELTPSNLQEFGSSLWHVHTFLGIYPVFKRLGVNKRIRLSNTCDNKGHIYWECPILKQQQPSTSEQSTHKSYPQGVKGRAPRHSLTQSQYKTIQIHQHQQHYHNIITDTETRDSLPPLLNDEEPSAFNTPPPSPKKKGKSNQAKTSHK